MTIRTPGSLAPIPTKRLRFDDYVLDLDRGCLLQGSAEIALRPKTLAVLLFLATNPGRLVSKHELFDAVWPNMAITDDVLVQSIGELRRALGDGGSRLIRTAPRRGYRFEAVVLSEDATVEAAASPQPAPVANDANALSPNCSIDASPPPGVAADGRTRRRMVLTASLGLIAAAVLLFGAVAEWDVRYVAIPGLRATAGIPAREAEPALAVLPLMVQSGDPAQAYFADGLTEDIINALGRFSALTVISWNGVLPYRANPATPEQVGRSLGVRYLVEGSVDRSGDRVRVTAELVDTQQGHLLWSTRFDEALADVFALQDDITTEIAGALAIHVQRMEQRRAFAKPTDNLAAYDDVLRARPALQRPTRSGLVEARRLLEHAIALDPNYADAYAALGESYYIATSMGWAESPPVFLKRAAALSNTALRLSDSQVRAHVILGRIDIVYRRFGEAATEMDQAVAINPNDANALAGRGNVLMWSGQTDAAIASLQLAKRLDPELNPMDRFALSLAYYQKGQYGAAIAQADMNLREDVGADFNRVVLAAAYAQEGDADDAARTVAAIRAADPTFDPATFGTKYLNSADLEHLRDGLRKAGLYQAASASNGSAGR
ncbi:MAG TPA: winged helix-turn-helix domain-containing protein [Acetobacteraceae bacterium]|nr:winged helix-turn-helix domain-containing protein [Acetobacteraceae bacterium]